MRLKASEQSDFSHKLSSDHLELFKKLVVNATDAIGISTPEGRHWYQNAAFDALFGDVGGDPPTTVYCDENVGREVFETIMAGGEWRGEVQMYAADGRVLDILLRAYAFTDETGRVLGLVGVHTDITTSKRSQELFKLLAQSTNDVFYEWDVMTDTLHWFSDIATELGYNPGEIPPTINGWIELIHPEDRPQLANAVETHRTATHDINYLYRMKHKDGSWRYWRDHATPVLDSQNRPIRWVGGISDITEQKQAEIELLREKNFSETLINRLPGSFYMFPENGRLLRWNYNLEKVTGYSTEEIQQMNALDFFDEDEKERVNGRIKEVFVSGESQVEAHLLTKDGRKIPHVLTGTKVEYNGVAYLLGVGLDITESKQVENALKESETRFRQITENIREVFWLFDWQEQRVLYVSPAYELIWGRSRETLYEHYDDWGESIHPDDVKYAQETFNRIVENGGGEPREYRIVRPDGSERWISDTGYAVKNGDGNIVRITGIAEDITERKKADEALRQSEAKFRELADMLPQIVFETDVKGNLTFVNQYAFHTFGYTKDDFATGLNAIQMIAHKDRDRAADRMVQIMKGKSYRKGTEYTAITKDGAKFPVIIYSTRFFHDGNLAGIRGIIVDITERQRAEREREKFRAKLIQAQKMESIGTLAGGIAHNFNNILMGIQGRTSLMMMDKDNSDPDYEHLKSIGEYVKNAVELTKDLLGYARGGKYEVRPTDLNALIRHENRMFCRTKKEIRIHEKYEKDLWTVEVDKNQIQQALLNLYVNAWQAMPGGGDLYVRTTNITLDEEYIKPFVVAPGKYIKVTVIDTGVGMDAMTREKIFDPFFSTKDIGQGSGLGLASVYGIIKNHDGFITVSSEKGKGTTFNIYLPASEKEVVVEDLTPKQHEVQQGQGTVLLVDDEVMIVEVGKLILEKLGYRVLTASSGQKAIDLYERLKEEIDLVILDMIMPGMGGGETFDRIKEIDGDALVLLSSGYSIEGQASEILNRGCSGFIQKPFMLEDFSQKVSGALAGDKSNV